jgi:spore maturation protein CgeB
MRVAIVDTYYVPFLRSHYRSNPALAEAMYREQIEALLARQMGTGDAYSHYLREHGHDAIELVANCATLQRAWAHEYGTSLLRIPGRVPGPLGQQALFHAVLHAQLRALDPDVVYLQDTRFLTRPELDALRRSGRFVVGQIASAAPPARVLRGYDLIVSSFPHFVARFSAMGIATEYLPIAFDERIRTRLEREGIDTSAEADRPSPVTFVGGLTAEHGRGTALLERVAGRLPLSVWGYGAESLPPGSCLRDRHHGEAWGIDMYRILARSQIVLNRHIDAAEGHANNMRMFETTGVGALLATERAPNLYELFEPGAEVLSYGSEAELVTLVEHQLKHPQERLRIAAAGQARTLSQHTYRARIGQLAELLERHLAAKR